jgi:hypothetical protein
MPGNAAFHPTIETVGFQTAFSVRKPSERFPQVQKSFLNPVRRISPIHCYTMGRII